MMAITQISAVSCIGNVCFDMPVWPVPEISWGKTTWVETIAESVGGNGANTSYTLGKLGVPIQLTGCVGNDPYGDFLLRALSQVDVDITRVRHTQSPTTCTVCIVHPSGERAFLHRVGASTELTGADMNFQGIASSHFHLANPFSLPQVRRETGPLMARAKAANLSTSVDAGWDSKGKWLEDLGPCLPHTDLLFINESEAKMLTGFNDPGSAAMHLQSLGAGSVVVKLGSRGCFVEGAIVPAFNVEVRDTTGAGDCFAGAFLCGLRQGWDYQRSARFANAVGALSVRNLGAVGGLLSFPDTMSWIESQTQ
jgi:sugar/nucleoside kinase (ribokinase family)